MRKSMGPGGSQQPVAPVSSPWRGDTHMQRIPRTQWIPRPVGCGSNISTAGSNFSTASLNYHRTYHGNFCQRLCCPLFMYRIGIHLVAYHCATVDVFSMRQPTSLHCTTMYYCSSSVYTLNGLHSCHICPFRAWPLSKSDPIHQPSTCANNLNGHIYYSRDGFE